MLSTSAPRDKRRSPSGHQRQPHCYGRWVPLVAAARHMSGPAAAKRRCSRLEDSLRSVPSSATGADESHRNRSNQSASREAVSIAFGGRE